MEVFALGDPTMLCRPCVDCGLYTGRFCDYCYDADRIPNDEWARGQLTPLCSRCDNRYDMCHFCRGVHMARPFALHPYAGIMESRMANPVSLLQSKRQEQPLAKHAMTCGLRKALHNNCKLERSHGAIATTGNENSSRPTGMVRCMHACERWPTPTPCAERPPWLWVLLQSKPRPSELRD